VNEKVRAVDIAIIVGFVAFLLGAITGYSAGPSIRSSETAKLTEKYDRETRERDATIASITEDNQRLRDGIKRAQTQLEIVTAGVARLEQYNGSAGDRNQSVIANLDGARQDLEEASRIIEHYLKEQ